MTTANSLFTCPDADITLQRIRELMSQNLPESLTLEYKLQYTPNIIKSVAAMANSYGGLILVGVSDEEIEDRLIGVPFNVMSQIVSACNSTFEPPWTPSIVPIPLLNVANTHIFVLRIYTDKSPRPILIKGAAPIRLQGQNDVADRGRLFQLFTESKFQSLGNRQSLSVPFIERDQNGLPKSDFIIRSGLILPVDETVGWNSLSEISESAVSLALNNSPLNMRLLKWIDGITEGFYPFHKEGFSRANRAQLKWQALTSRTERSTPVESIAEIKLLGVEGEAFTTLHFTLDLIVNIRLYLSAVSSSTQPENNWSLTMPDLYESLESILETLAEPNLITALTTITGTDESLAFHSAISYFITGPKVSELLNLYGLTQVPQTSSESYGANLVANPTLDWSSEADRRSQLDAWLIKIALDSELTGMQALLEEYHNR